MCSIYTTPVYVHMMFEKCLGGMFQTKNYPAAQPVLPISHHSRQNQAEDGIAKIKVNPNEVRQEIGLPLPVTSFID